MPQRPPTFGHKPTQRPSSAKRGYGRRWREYRATYLAVHRACVGADGKGKHARDCDGVAIVVDHIRPVKGPYDPWFWESSNHQPLSQACHNLKSEHDGTRTRDGGRWSAT